MGPTTVGPIMGDLGEAWWCPNICKRKENQNTELIHVPNTCIPISHGEALYHLSYFKDGT